VKPPADRPKIDLKQRELTGGEKFFNVQLKPFAKKQKEAEAKLEVEDDDKLKVRSTPRRLIILNINAPWNNINMYISSIRQQNDLKDQHGEIEFLKCGTIT